MTNPKNREELYELADQIARDAWNGWYGSGLAAADDLAPRRDPR